MNKIIFILIAIFFFEAANARNCTEEEFKVLDGEIANNQKKHEVETLAQFDNYLQQIKTRKNMTDKELFSYRTDLLNNPKVKKLHAKERTTTYMNYASIALDGDCKTLKKWTDESMASANKQWNIIFEELKKELKK